MVLRVISSVFVRLYEFPPHQCSVLFRKFHVVMEKFNDDRTHRMYFVFFYEIVVRINRTVLAHSEEFVLQRAVRKARV